MRKTKFRFNPETLEYENHEGKREEIHDSEKVKRPID